MVPVNPSVAAAVVVFAVVLLCSGHGATASFTLDDLAFCAEHLPDIVHVPTKSSVSPTIVRIHEEFVALLIAERQLPKRIRVTTSGDVITDPAPKQPRARGGPSPVVATTTTAAPPAPSEATSGSEREPPPKMSSPSGSASQEQLPPDSSAASSPSSVFAPPRSADNAGATPVPKTPDARDEAASLNDLPPAPRVSPDAFGNAAAPFWRLERSPATAARCAFLTNVSSLSEVRRQILGIDPAWEALGFGGTPGGIDRTKGPQAPVDPPIPLSRAPKRVTESVVTHFGASPVQRPFQMMVNLLLLRPPKTTFLQSSKTLKAKDVVERSASFYDKREQRVHIVRIRWVKLFYLESAPWYLRLVAGAYADHEVKDAASGRTYTVRAEDVVGGYLAMSAGTWDMSYMNGKPTPGVAGNRNETEAMISWKRQSAALAVALKDVLSKTPSAGAARGSEGVSTTAPVATAASSAGSSKAAPAAPPSTTSPYPANVLYRIPIMWRDQPLPRCESHRYSRPSKLAMRCAPVLRPILVPFYRNTIRAALKPLGVLFLPVDYITQPLETPPSSSSVAPTIQPPPWFNAAEVKAAEGLHKYLSPLHDGVHLEPPGMYLELGVYWAFAARWLDFSRRTYGSTVLAVGSSPPYYSQRVATSLSTGSATTGPSSDDSAAAPSSAPLALFTNTSPPTAATASSRPSGNATPEPIGTSSLLLPTARVRRISGAHDAAAVDLEYIEHAPAVELSSPAAAAGSERGATKGAFGIHHDMLQALCLGVLLTAVVVMLRKLSH
jgi:hypothetical protein